jgi:hypothetical protein
MSLKDALTLMEGRREAKAMLVAKGGNRLKEKQASKAPVSTRLAP